MTPEQEYLASALDRVAASYTDCKIKRDVERAAAMLRSDRLAALAGAAQDVPTALDNMELRLIDAIEERDHLLNLVFGSATAGKWIPVKPEGAPYWGIHTADGRTIAGTSSGLSEGDAKLICALHEQASHAPAKAREDGLAWVQAQLPRRVESSAFGDLNAEELSIFDNGYNAALLLAHNLLTAAIGGGGHD